MTTYEYAVMVTDHDPFPETNMVLGATVTATDGLGIFNEMGAQGWRVSCTLPVPGTSNSYTLFERPLVADGPA